MKLPSVVATIKARNPIIIIMAVCLLIAGASAAIYVYHSRTTSTPVPSVTVTLPDSPKIQKAADLDAANETLDKLNTLNSDFQKEEERLKQLMDEAH